MAETRRSLSDEDLESLLQRMSGDSRERLLNALARFLLEEERRAERLKKLRSIT